MRCGPSVTMVRTTRSSHRPAPASSVSRTCNSNESSSLVTQAIPPCAQAVFVSEPLRFVITATEPCFAALSAKLSPAMPLPTTTKSYSFIQYNVVDQTGFPKENREREKRVWPRRFYRLQSVCVDKIDIIDSRQRRFTDYLSRKIDSVLRGFFFGIFRGQQCFAQNRGLLPLVGGQIHVARTARQSICFAHGGDRDDVDLVIQIAHHSANDGQLLKIFFAKYGRVRLQNVEQFRHHRANAAEMSRPRFAFEHARQRIFFHRHRAIIRIHLGRAWPKQKIDIQLSAQFFVFLFWSRITFVIASRLELERIYKNADDHFAIFPRLAARNSN